MSFSVITANPSWGSALNTSSNGVAFYDNTEYYTTTYDQGSSYPSSLSALMSNAVNTSGIVKPLGGWVAYTEGGGGGSTRPVTGMIYPRGTC